MSKLLVVVDYQVDFVSGSLGFDGAKDLEVPIKNRVLEYLSAGEDVVYTLDTHKDNYLQSNEGHNLPIKHCIIGTKGHELYGSLKDLLKEKKSFIKYTFGSKELAEYIGENKYDEIEFCGLVSNICVISNMVLAKAFSPESRIYVNRKLTGSNDEEIQEKAFDVLKNLHMEVLDD